MLPATFVLNSGKSVQLFVPVDFRTRLVGAAVEMDDADGGGERVMVVPLEWWMAHSYVEFAALVGTRRQPQELVRGGDWPRHFDPLAGAGDVREDGGRAGDGGSSLDAKGHAAGVSKPTIT